MSPSEQRDRRIGLACAAAGAVLFSAKAIVAKYQYAQGLDALDVMALRMLMAWPLFLLLGLHEWRRGPGPAISAREKGLLLVVGLLGYYLASLLDFWGLQYIPVALERLILFLSPTFVLLIGLLFLGQRLGPRHWFALAASYAGIVLVMVENLRLEGGPILFGSLLCLGAALSYAVYLVLSGQLVQRLGTARLVVAAMTISTLATLLHYLLLRDVDCLLSWPAEAYAWAAVNALLCTFLPVTLTMAAVRRIGSAGAAQLSVLGPVSLLFLGAWLLAEPISALQLLGTAVVLAAVMLLSRGPMTR